MAIETPDFITLKEVDDKSRQEDQRTLAGNLPPRVVSREYAAQFQFPIEQEHVIRHFARDGERFQYDRDGVSFQWLVRSFGSKWIPHPDYPEEFHRRILVGTIDALLVPAPDATLYTVNIPEAVGV